MGRPAPQWFAELVDLKFDRWYTAPSLARRFKRSAADIRMVLSRRLKPVYQTMNGEIFATWIGSDLIKIGEEYRVNRKVIDEKKANKGPKNSLETSEVL